MGLVETEGLVLRKYNLADADRIVVVLTEKQGMIRGVASGAKRLKSKFHSSLEFFSRIRISYFQKEEKELVAIRETELIESVFTRISNPQFFDSFAEIADLLIRYTPLNEPNKRLYDMTVHCLKTVIEDDESIEAVRAYFEIWLLKLGGFLPSWDKCGRCAGGLTDEGTFLNADFQLQCRSCSGTGNLIPREVVYLALLAQKTGPLPFSKKAQELKQHLNELQGILSDLSNLVLERSPVGNFKEQRAT